MEDVEEREFSSPVCYLDFDRDVSATPRALKCGAKGTQAEAKASSAGENGSRKGEGKAMGESAESAESGSVAAAAGTT
jgi:hypothetical protein